jgi:hypothetical protein
VISFYFFVFLKTTKIDSLTVLEARSLKSRWQQGHASPEDTRGKSSLASL